MLTRRQFALAAALQARRRPNVLILLASQWRRQTMPREERALAAPNLARLTGESVELTRAYTADPAPGPAQAAMWTGRLAHAAGVPWDGRELGGDHPSLADGFVEAGYRTGYFGRWELGAGGRRGFTVWQGGPEDRGPEAVAEAGLRFLGQDPKTPFLLTVAFGARRGGAYAADALTPRENVPAKGAAEARTAMAAYYGMCSAIDGQIGRLLAAVPEDTIVVFTSTGGEMLGSHGLNGAGVWYEESAGVPLLVRWTGELAGGTQQDWLCNQIDLAPTVRGLCGLGALEDAHGEDRSELLRHKGTGARTESTYLQGQLGTAREWRTVIRGWDKLVVDRELKPAHLYNLAVDPLEKDDLIIDRASIRRQEELLALMRRWINKTGDRVPYPGKAPVQERETHE